MRKQPAHHSDQQWERREDSKWVLLLFHVVGGCHKKWVHFEERKKQVKNLISCSTSHRFSN